jgi:Fe-Mn family superoxide dismutase
MGTGGKTMPVTLEPLPYALDALAPVISAQALAIHHGRHHRGYVERLNAAVAGTDLESAPLDRIVRQAARGRTTAKRLAIFNNAAQAWNHQFFWRSLRPGAGRPGEDLAARIARDFGSHEAFAAAFKASAAGHFGSGWAWLVLERGLLRIVTTQNADTPIAHGRTPLLVIDLWEHAYYLDHHERRSAYVEGVVDHLLDWDFAAGNLQRWYAERHAAESAMEAGHA